ncbi:MAG: SDR family oxidoreductase [Elusimicrobia bacterium]|nr:SDR family oxidoreductase [Elusimicrobiota bacterium]
MSEGPAPLDIEEVRRCTKVLQAIVKDRTVLATVPEEERLALIIAAGRASRPERYELIRLSRALSRAEYRRKKEEDRAIRSQTQIRVARLAAVFVAPSPVAPQARAAATERPELSEPRHCYVCKVSFRKLHFFYDAMCSACGDFNYGKRFQTADLRGKAAVITGARLKIGYQASLMLLRAGATVVATTRFPHDAARRYAREEDFDAWKDRLKVHGLDLRHTPSVELFCRYVESELERLDVLINNAAQTVRRPPAFYGHLLDYERLPASELPPRERELLASHERLTALLAGAGAPARLEGVDATGLAVWHRGGPGVGLRESALLSQLKYAYDDAEVGLHVFPEGRTDADLQQVDLRKMNSWRMALAEVPTAEMLELQLINAVAPFVLCAKLKPLMLRRRSFDKHVVNVSAMEGSFSRGTKTDKHPHTNMAKAALNMLTLTSARDYVRDGIHMNAVDTGWVTDEDPAHFSASKQEVHDFQPPLDIVDGAARVCDPVFSGLLTGQHLHGKFFKDYKPTAW